MSCLAADLLAGKVTPAVANATLSACDKLLKVAELRLKLGDRLPEGKGGMLLISEAPK